MAKTNKKLYEMMDDELAPYLVSLSSDINRGQFKSNISYSDFQRTIDLSRSLISADQLFVPLMQGNLYDKNGEEIPFKRYPKEVDFEYARNILDESFENAKEALSILSDTEDELKIRAIEHLKKELKDIQETSAMLKMLQYSGPYRSFNERMRNLYIERDPETKFSYGQLKKGEHYGKRKRLTDALFRFKKYPISHERKKEYWNWISATAMLQMWKNFRKIYEIDPNLALDFANQKRVFLPEDALNYIPFPVFYIDLSTIPQLDLQLASITGILVRIVKTSDGHCIQLLSEVYTHAGKKSNQDRIIVLSNEHKEGYHLTETNIEKEIQFAGTFYLKKNESLSVGSFHDEEEIAKLYQNREFEILCDTQKECEKITKKIETDTQKAMEMAAKTILCTIFYLCCNNNKTPRANRSNYIRKNKKEKRQPNEKIVKDVTVIGTSTIRLSQKDYDDLERDRKEYASTGKRKSDKPILVPGHYQHYWVGKRTDKNRESIYKYKKPYWKGIKEHKKTDQRTIIKN